MTTALAPILRGMAPCRYMDAAYGCPRLRGSQPGNRRKPTGTVGHDRHRPPSSHSVGADERYSRDTAARERARTTRSRVAQPAQDSPTRDNRDGNADRRPADAVARETRPETANQGDENGALSEPDWSDARSVCRIPPPPPPGGKTPRRARRSRRHDHNTTRAAPGRALRTPAQTCAERSEPRRAHLYSPVLTNVKARPRTRPQPLAHPFARFIFLLQSARLCTTLIADRPRW